MKSPFNKWYENIGYYALFLITIFLATLRATHIINISWWAVLVPLYIIVTGVIIIVVATSVAYSINPPYFTNSAGTFSDFDIVVDTESLIRPTEGGALKFEYPNGWYIVYLDGFEASITHKDNIKFYHIKQV